MTVKPLSPLDHDIQMDFHSIHAKQGHFGSSTDYIAARRQVVHRSWGARRRLWGLLPPKAVPPTEDCLDIPDYIKTEDELWDYVRQNRPFWVRTGSPRHTR